MMPGSLVGKITRIILPIFLVAVGLASGCVSVPFDYPKIESQAIPASSSTTLGRDAAAWSAEHDGLSGFLPLHKGDEALGARLRLIEEAEVSIDAQYFLMKKDMAGALFAGGLLQAADRGVKVRFLLDDIFTPNLDTELALLNSHPNIEIRLFNPMSRQSAKGWSLLWDFNRANRRMHNKSFTVDNSYTIVGGRNIAEEYFEIQQDVEFVDLELLGLGPVAAKVSKTFDLFWNSQLSVPVEAFGKKVDPEDLDEVRRELIEDMTEAERTIYAEAVNSRFLLDVLNDVVSPVPAPAGVVTDSPKKLKTAVGNEELQELAWEIIRRADRAKKEVVILTPYFVPGQEGADFIASIAERGVKVVIVTNSLASTNHVPVHSGYARHRKQLVRAGVELYEVRADALKVMDPENKDAMKLTLHTKAMMFDQETVFVGSLNLDPRSIEINSEMGLFVESKSLAEWIAVELYEDLETTTYRVTLEEDGGLLWTYGQGDSAKTFRNEPQAGFWRRFGSGFYSGLQIDSQL